MATSHRLPGLDRKPASGSTGRNSGFPSVPASRAAGAAGVGGADGSWQGAPMVVDRQAQSLTWTFCDGAWLEGNVPLIGPRTHSFWMASSVFDGARWFEGVAPDLDRHCARVNVSARAM